MMSVKSKNIHVLPTDKPSKLFYNVGGALLFTKWDNYNGVNIYITSDEEIKEGDWVLFISTNEVIKVPLGGFKGKVCKKIILTTDRDLIKDGVQAIDDDFLEWFVNNPSCEEVEVNFVTKQLVKPYDVYNESVSLYKIIIPKEELTQTDEKGNTLTYWGGLEEPKQETLELAAKEFSNNSAVNNYEHGINVGKYQGFIDGAKWQQERMYSYEEVLEQLNLLYSMKNSLVDTFTDENDYITMKWFEQFKNK